MADLAAQGKKIMMALASSRTIPNPQNHQRKPPHAMRPPTQFPHPGLVEVYPTNVALVDLVDHLMLGTSKVFKT